MASAYIWTGTRFVATWRLRVNRHQMDPDIAKDPAVLAERRAYEERRHCAVSARVEDRFWLEDN